MLDLVWQEGYLYLSRLRVLRLECVGFAEWPDIMIELENPFNHGV